MAKKKARKKSPSFSDMLQKNIDRQKAGFGKVTKKVKKTLKM